MKIFGNLAGLAVLALFPGIAGPGPAPTSPTERVQSLGWLTGAWRGRAGPNDYEAVYTSAEAGEILGASKEIAKGRVVVFDFERIAARGDAVFLTPWPFGKKSVSFKLVGHDPAVQRAAFENPAHDFPRRYTYELVAKDRLRIRLEGERRGKRTTLTVELRRR